MRNSLLFFISIGFFVLGCNDAQNSSNNKSTGTGKSSIILPLILGKPGDVFFILDTTVFDGNVIDSIYALMEQPIAPSLRPENVFNIYVQDYSKFNSSVKRRGNIFYIVIDTSLTTATVETQRDVYVQDQLLYSILTNNEFSLLELITKNKASWINTINLNERKRLQKKYYTSRNLRISNLLKEQHYFTLNLPPSYILRRNDTTIIQLEKDKTRKLWTKSEGGGTQLVGHQIIQGIFIYTYPLTSKMKLSFDTIVYKRNQAMKHLQMENPGEFMETVTIEGLKPQYKDAFLGANKGVELRGLWGVYDAEHKPVGWGGSFMSLSIFDRKRSRVIVLDSYLYAPKFRKREYLRELEAIIYSLELY